MRPNTMANTTGGPALPLISGWSEPLGLDRPGSELSHVPDQMTFELFG
jgi:hypothetical protein